MITIAATSCYLAAVVFAVVYAFSAPWWRSRMGISIMALDLAVATLAAGTIIRTHGHPTFGDNALVVAYFAAAVIICWRGIIMLHAQHHHRHKKGKGNEKPRKA